MHGSINNILCAIDMEINMEGKAWASKTMHTTMINNSHLLDTTEPASFTILPMRLYDCHSSHTCTSTGTVESSLYDLMSLGKYQI